MLRAATHVWQLKRGWRIDQEWHEQGEDERTGIKEAIGLKDVLSARKAILRMINRMNLVVAALLCAGLGNVLLIFSPYDFRLSNKMPVGPNLPVWIKELYTDVENNLVKLPLPPADLKS